MISFRYLKPHNGKTPVFKVKERVYTDSLYGSTVELSVSRQSHSKKYYHIGSIRLVKINRIKGQKKLRYETHSGLRRDSDKGKGYGMLLYSIAADYAHHNKFILCSSGQSSDEALRVWNSTTMRKYYLFQKRNKRWYIKLKRGVKPRIMWKQTAQKRDCSGQFA